MKSSLVLSTAARSAIVSSYIAALNTAENTGGLITQVCEVATRYTKGNPLSDDDSKAIVSDISKHKGWKGTSARSRESEVRIVLRSAHVLPEAIEAYHAKAKTCTWHDSMKLARGLAKGKSITQCVKLAMESSAPGVRGTPEGRTAGALKAWFKVARGPKKAAILEAAATLGLKLGVKLDA